MSKKDVMRPFFGEGLASSPLLTRSFSVHGWSLNVITNSDFILTSVTELLEYFRCSDVIEKPDMKFCLMESPFSRFPLLPTVRKEGCLLFNSEDEDLLHVSREMGIDLRFLSWREFYLADFGSKGVLLLHIPEGVGMGIFPNASCIHPRILSNFIFLTGLSEILRSRGLYPVHGAGLANGEQGILIPGFTGSGKTTLSIALLRKGFRFLSDDRSLLRENEAGFELLAFPEGLDVTGKTISFFPEIREKLGGFSETSLHKRTFRVESVYPDTLTRRCSPKTLIFPKIAERTFSRLEPISRMEAIERFLPHSLLVFDQGIAEKQFYFLCQLVQKMDCYRLHFGKDLLDVSRLIEEIL